VLISHNRKERCGTSVAIVEPEISPAIGEAPSAAHRGAPTPEEPRNYAKRIWIGFMLAGLTLLVIGIASFRSIQELSRRQQGVERTYQAIDDLWRLLASAQGAVLEERLYVMTGDQAYTTQMHANLGGFEACLSQLANLLSNDPRNAYDLEPLSHAVASLGAFAASVADKRRQDGEAAAVAMIQTGTGISLLEEITQHVQDLSAQERALLERRSAATVAGGATTLRTIIVGSLFMVICSGYAGWYAWRSVQAFHASADALANSHELLNQLNAELGRSNAELEQFAYSASHDLQEPLRMVASYVQLIRQRYRGRLDADADEFIDFAVDGASRMKRLINDLLHYSRTGRGAVPRPTESGQALDWALSNLALRLEETHTTVTHGEMPMVQADPTQLGEIFQNLIDNAIKFHGSEPPRIEISAQQEAGHWLFSLKDNGIGIEPQHRNRIFQMFQRLHGHNEYSGTGIGLAVCRKIIERHGGRIWVESVKDCGSDFRFTLPAVNPAVANSLPETDSPPTLEARNGTASA
jgi:signal transduction histidine kinase